MATETFNLQRLLDHELTSSDIEKVIETFESVLQSLSEANAEEQAQKMASRLQEEVSVDKPDSQFENIWETILSVARHIPHRDDQKQEFMVKVLQILVPTPPWTGVPFLGMIMRENWNHSPVFEDPEERDPEDDQCFTYDQWLNLNSFCARLFKAGVFRTQTLVLWEMRSGLERELPADAETDCQLCVASEWVIQSAPALLRQCLEDRGFDKEADERAHQPGPLFEGRAGLHLEHWGFWKRRFGEVRSIASSEQAIASIDEAVRCMTAAEKAFAQAELK